MSLPRSIPRRPLPSLRPLRSSRQTSFAQQWQRGGRRGYAGAQETAQKAKEKAKGLSGDLPWAIGATVITIPSVYLILANGSHGHEKGYPGDLYHGSHGDEHGEEGEEEGGEGEGESGGEEAPGEAQGGDGEESEGNSESNSESDSEGSSDDGGQDTDASSETSDDDSKTAQAKGGETDSDKAAAGTPTKDLGAQNAQEGLSNTDTKHSTDIENDPNKSKKSDGTPDTAKSKGTIDPGESGSG